eukprot:9492681-Pyramimonas_sp.AAC.1
MLRLLLGAAAAAIAAATAPIRIRLLQVQIDLSTRATLQWDRCSARFGWAGGWPTFAYKNGKKEAEEQAEEDEQLQGIGRGGRV